MTEEEYLAFERASPERHEFLAGEIYAMSGASRRHGLITGDTFGSLRDQLRGRPCEVHVADLRVRIEASGLYTYPDVVVVCGEPQFLDSELDTLANPALLAEVLSPSTADYDRGGKFAHYRTLPSLAEYLVIEQEKVLVEHHVKQPDGSWLLTESRDLGATLELPSIGCRLALADIYERVFPAG
jgi:Uma2 family endonuclease